MKKFVLLAVMLFCSHLLFAQDEESSGGFQKDRLFTGGSFGLSLGDYTLVNISPQVGYRFNQYFSAGLGLNLEYASLKEQVNGFDYSKTTTWVTGLSLITRFQPIQQFLIQLQPEANYIFGDIKYYQPTETKYKLDAEIVPSMLAGGGIVVPSGRGAVITTVMYDLLQQPHSPYGNRPIISIGYTHNF